MLGRHLLEHVFRDMLGDQRLQRAAIGQRIGAQTYLNDVLPVAVGEQRPQRLVEIGSQEGERCDQCPRADSRDPLEQGACPGLRPAV